jgi:hypothetical protein
MQVFKNVLIYPIGEENSEGKGSFIKQLLLHSFKMKQLFKTNFRFVSFLLNGEACGWSYPSHSPMQFTVSYAVSPFFGNYSFTPVLSTTP